MQSARSAQILSPGRPHGLNRSSQIIPRPRVLEVGPIFRSEKSFTHRQDRTSHRVMRTKLYYGIEESQEGLVARLMVDFSEDANVLPASVSPQILLELDKPRSLFVSRPPSFLPLDRSLLSPYEARA